MITAGVSLQVFNISLWILAYYVIADMIIVPAIDHNDIRAHLRSNLTNALLLITPFTFFSFISLGENSNQEGHSPGAHKDKMTQTTCCLVVMAGGLVDFPCLSTLNLSGVIEN